MKDSLIQLQSALMRIHVWRVGSRRERLEGELISKLRMVIQELPLEHGNSLDPTK